MIKTCYYDNPYGHIECAFNSYIIECIQHTTVVAIDMSYMEYAYSISIKLRNNGTHGLDIRIKNIGWTKSIAEDVRDYVFGCFTTSDDVDLNIVIDHIRGNEEWHTSYDTELAFEFC